MSNEIAPTQETQALSPYVAEQRALYQLAKAFSTDKQAPRAMKDSFYACYAAAEMAKRLNAPLATVGNNMVFVSGNFGWSGQFYASLVYQSKKWTEVNYVYLNGKDYKDGVQVEGIRPNGRIDYGTPVTPEMVKGEGWDRNPKWKTMPDLMYKYRAMSFFGKTYCPEATMGLQTGEELQDMEATAKPEPSWKSKPQMNADVVDVSDPEADCAGATAFDPNC